MAINVFNRCWARVILETVVKSGVKNICIAAGSRSTPLTFEANNLNNQKRIACHTHFDERGLGFFALGLAKSSNSPVAIIVTSGTAVANLYPAVIEARQTGVPLIVITADRPMEQLECGANQTIVQENIFADYPVAKVHLPNPSSAFSGNYLITILEEAFHKQKLYGGVVHINAPFAEPLYQAEEDDIDVHPWLEDCNDYFASSASLLDYSRPYLQVLTDPAWESFHDQRGVILVGKLDYSDSLVVEKWVKNMGWTVITDIQSNIQGSLPFADIWLANQTVKSKLLQADIVVQLGGHFLSKHLNQFLQEYRGEYWIISPELQRLDPFHHRVRYFKVPIGDWVEAHQPFHQSPWLLEPIALSKFCEEFIEQNLSSGLNEASLAFNLEKLIPTGCDLFLGNSLFIRLANAFSKLPENCRLFTNRGASGIDGLIASSVGVNVGSVKRPTIAILGDTSCLHDLNSLALIQKVTQPIIIIVINNNGGAIFDLFPIPADIKKKYYQMPHHLEFSQVASMFNLKYALPHTWSDFNLVLRQAFKQRATLIELKLSNTGGTHFYRYILEEISQAIIGE